MKTIDIKKYEYYIAPTSQFYYCGVPFRLDMRPKCFIDCVYCFARSRGGRRTNCSQIADVVAFKRKFQKAIDPSIKSYDIVSELLERRMPIHLGGMSDPFSDSTTTSQTKELLKFLQPYNYPIILSTKMPGKLLEQDFTGALEYTNMIVQVSISTNDSVMQSAFEPNAEPIENRIANMEKLLSKHLKVSCRIQPIIPNATNLYSILDTLYEIKCKHVIMEMLKIPVEKSLIDFNAINKVLGCDIREYYKKINAFLMGREWILPTEFRYDILSKAKKYANGKGILVSLADYGLYHLSDCLCCCGVDVFELDCSWNEGNYSTLLNKKPGIIKISDLLEEYNFPQRNISRYINSNSRLEKNGIEDYIVYRWNKPGTVNAPDSFLGVRAVNDKDEAGNQIYFNESHLWRC